MVYCIFYALSESMNIHTYMIAPEKDIQTSEINKGNET